jgi:hypothetical protein
MIRRWLLAKGDAHFQHLVAKLGPYSISALLATLALLFAFQGEAIFHGPLVIAMLAVPILIKVFFNSGLAYLLNRRLGVAHCVAGPSSLIGASNFFELAVSTAISLFRFHSEPRWPPWSGCSSKCRSCCWWSVSSTARNAVQNPVHRPMHLPSEWRESLNVRIGEDETVGRETQTPQRVLLARAFPASTRGVFVHR